jgi:NRAMP (natural resistance-associated macrophage protein)-like metal ion transporter
MNTLARQTPAALLDAELRISETLEKGNRIRRFISMLGPGLITGASDDDPSGIGTYSMAGAAFGFGTLWTAPLTLPLMAAVQYTCAKIGMVSGCGLTSILRKHYSPAIVYPAVIGLVVANVINAGADIAAIASAINLLIPISTSILVVVIAAAILGLQIVGSYRTIASIFKWLTLALFAYIGTAFFVKLDPVQIASATFKPTITFDGAFLSMMLAILGTSISPYLFFWQTDQEVEEKVRAGKTRLWQRRGVKPTELKERAVDVWCGMFLCAIVMYFIMLATGATLFRAGQHNISTAAEAALALKPLAGEGATVLFALGIIGSGLLAIPILTTSAAYAVAQVFGWKHGLSHKAKDAKKFYAAIIVFTMAGAALNFAGVNPIKSLFLAATINGLTAPPLLILIMLIANNKKVMGEHTNGRVTNLVCLICIALMLAVAIGMFMTFKPQ